MIFNIYFKNLILIWNIPFQYLLHYLKFLKDWFEPYKWETTPIARSAWTFLKDSYHGNLCLLHKPQHIAVGLIYMALECHGVEVPLQSSVAIPWWKVIVFLMLDYNIVVHGLKFLLIKGAISKLHGVEVPFQLNAVIPWRKITLVLGTICLLILVYNIELVLASGSIGLRHT